MASGVGARSFLGAVGSWERAAALPSKVGGGTNPGLPPRRVARGYGRVSMWVKRQFDRMQAGCRVWGKSRARTKSIARGNAEGIGREASGVE